MISTTVAFVRTLFNDFKQSASMSVRGVDVVEVEF